MILQILHNTAKFKKILQKNRNMLGPDYLPLAMTKEKNRINHYEKKSNRRSDYLLSSSERFG
jgi:hypothetical protein